MFAKDLTGAGVLARAPGPVEHMNGIGGMSKHDIGNNDPRKPWEAVQLDPSLKPKSYQIKGSGRLMHFVFDVLTDQGRQRNLASWF